MARDERRSNTSIHMPDSQLGFKSTKIPLNFQSHCDEIDEKRQGGCQNQVPTHHKWFFLPRCRHRFGRLRCFELGCETTPLRIRRLSSACLCLTSRDRPGESSPEGVNRIDVLTDFSLLSAASAAAARAPSVVL